MFLGQNGVDVIPEICGDIVVFVFTYLYSSEFPSYCPAWHVTCTIHCGFVQRFTSTMFRLFVSTIPVLHTA